jgi:hypothetical protein
VAVWRPASDPPRSPPAAGAVRTAGSFAASSPALSALPGWQFKLALMAACTVPGLLVRLSGAHVAPPLGIVVFGGAVMAAAFMLAAAAEAAEIDVSPGLAVAGCTSRSAVTWNS